MKKSTYLLLIALNSLLFSGYALAQSEMDILVRHGISNIQTHPTDLFICQTIRYRIANFGRPDQKMEYETCIRDFKKNLENNYILTNRYLNEKGYSQSSIALKKYYISLLREASLDSIPRNESNAAKTMREEREKNLSQDVKLEYSAFITELRIEGN